MNIYFEVFLVAGDGGSESGASGGVLPCNSNLNVERWQPRQGTGNNKNHQFPIVKYLKCHHAENCMNFSTQINQMKFILLA